MLQSISILGSTGSIGRQTLDVISRLPIRAAALTAGANTALMERQCRQFRPKLAVMATERAAKELKIRLADCPEIAVSWGEAGLIEAASLPQADAVVTALVGTVGLKPTLAAIRCGKRIALANKETLVCAGELVMRAAREYNAQIVPVDSEHSAIFQCLMGCVDGRQIRRLILTCSGGPFYGLAKEDLKHVRKADALKHPNWKMGDKITIDCATLMNKGLEVIEAMHLYGLPSDQVDVLIHRQSIVHSLVEFCDSSILAQMGLPDMRLPIQLALTYPERTESPVAPLDLTQCDPLTFERPDPARFPCYALARRAAETGGSVCAVMNAANEEAVALFLTDRIGFYEIPELVSEAMAQIENVASPSLDEILAADRAARELVKSSMRG